MTSDLQIQEAAPVKKSIISLYNGVRNNISTLYAKHPWLVVRNQKISLWFDLFIKYKILK